MLEQELSSISRMLMKPFRIRFMGSESTGKTQTSLKISKIFGGHWIPEYARSVWHNLRDTSPYHWVDIIAKGQAYYDLSSLKIAKKSQNNENPMQGNSMLTVHDTDISTTIIYLQQTTDHTLEKNIMHAVKMAKALVKYDITFVMCSYAPWVDDGVRGESLHDGHHYTAKWMQYLNDSNNLFYFIDGDWQDRVKKCTKIVHHHLLKEVDEGKFIHPKHITK